MRSPRRWLRRVLVIAIAAASALAGAAAWAYSRHDINTIGSHDFLTPLAIPPILDGENRPDGSVGYTLQLAPDATTLGSIEPGSRWGINGTSPGPTLRMRTGDTVTVDVTNQLHEPTTLHWHGMHLPAIADGGPHQPIEPGATWHPTWTVDQAATTLWYHPHPHGRTRAHVQRGIAGMILVDDPLATGGTLPDRYGLDDIPVIIQDFDQSDPMGGDGLGDTIAVNGTIDPHLAVTTDKVRLRLLNASVHRQYRLVFDDHRSFRLVGTDGGLLPAPVELTEIQLSPGERADIVIDVRPGDHPVLRSEPPELGSDWFSRRFQGGDDRFDILQLRAMNTLESVPAVALEPGAARTIDDLGPATHERRFELAGRHINGRSMDPGTIDFAVTIDTTEDWTVRNTDSNPHTFHVHDTQFHVVSVNGRPPPPQLTGPKDTISIPAGDEFVLRIRFTDHPDPDNPYMLHCHLLDHEDAGMMQQFIVIEAGQQPGTPPHHHDATG